MTVEEILSKLPELTDDELSSIHEQTEELLGMGSLSGRLRRIFKKEGKQSCINYLTQVRGWSLMQSKVYFNGLGIE